MPDQKPLNALKNVPTIQADPDPMMQFRSAHPWIAGTADFLTGGATDPYHKTGIGDVAAAAAPLIPLSRIPASLDYVTNILKDVGYGAQSTEGANPAVRALTSALESSLPEANLAQHAATSRVTGRLMPQRGILDLPEGFTFAPGFKAPPRVVPEEQQIWRDWTNTQKRMAGDIRLDKRGAALPELKQIEQAPVIKGIEELQSLPVTAGAQTERPAISAITKRPTVDSTKKEGRVSFRDLSPEDIKRIQRAAAGGMSATDLTKKFPQYSKATVSQALKAPWKD